MRCYDWIFQGRASRTYEAPSNEMSKMSDAQQPQEHSMYFANAVGISHFSDPSGRKTVFHVKHCSPTGNINNNRTLKNKKAML